MPTLTPDVLAHERDLTRELARRDPVVFINEFVKTYDPRKTPAVIPFALFPKQEEFIRWLDARYNGREDGLVEKSRDMGVTWLCLAYATWLWLFTPECKVAFGSRKENLVDKLGDPDSIFEKIRMLLRELPPELLPDGFSVSDHANFMKIVNPANGATITGEAGDNIGRGGRNSIYFKDESAFYERPERIEAALSQNSDCKIDVSTPNGTGNPFYRKRHAGIIPVFTFHWRDDPRKSPEWYARQQALLDPIIVAQEIDIDYTASVEDIIIPGAWVQAAVGFTGAVASKRGIAALDVGGGRDKSVFMVRWGGVVSHVAARQDGDTTETALWALGLFKESDAADLHFDSVGIGQGVASTLRHHAADAVPVNGGDTPSENEWSDGLTSKEKFANARAEMWWKMRDAFRESYERRHGGGGTHGIEPISIPADCHELISQLSLPKWKRTAAGKILIESKDEMRRRGVKSPDFADALAMTFYAPTAADEWLV